jgi:muramoyltetrapeptide carboxypeptidase
MKRLSVGDKVAIIAPSAKIEKKEKIEKLLQYVENLGLVPVFGKNVFSSKRYMAGTDEERASDVNEAFANPDIKAVFCVRAAAGASRILPFIDFDLIKNNPKPLIGFCDNSALMLAINTLSGGISWNGFVLNEEFPNNYLSDNIKNSLFGLINGNPLLINSGEKIRGGIAEGNLICSNLTTLLYLAGTKYFPDLDGKILLIEDVREKMHRLDLMLQHLKLLPSFGKLRGIILGGFTDLSAMEEDGTLDDCINDFIENTTCPVIKNFKFSHAKDRYVLPLGAKVRLDADDTSLEILSY